VICNFTSKVGSPGLLTSFRKLLEVSYTGYSVTCSAVFYQKMLT